MNPSTPAFDEICNHVTLHINHDDIVQTDIDILVFLLHPARNEAQLMRNLRGRVTFEFEADARRHLRGGRPSEQLRRYVQTLHARIPGLAWLLPPGDEWVKLIAVCHARGPVRIDPAVTPPAWILTREDAKSAADALARGLVEMGRYVAADYDEWADIEVANRACLMRMVR